MTRRSISTSLKRLGVRECLGSGWKRTRRSRTRHSAKCAHFTRYTTEAHPSTNAWPQAAHAFGRCSRRHPRDTATCFLRLEERAHPNGHHCVQFCCLCERWIDEKKRSTNSYVNYLSKNKCFSQTGDDTCAHFTRRATEAHPSTKHVAVSGTRLRKVLEKASP
jgi:hypothetical protein